MTRSGISKNRMVSILIAASQAYTFALFTESIPGAIAAPSFSSRLLMVVTLTAGAVFVMWLGEQITERGIGNGMSLLITFSILERLWPSTIQTIQFMKAQVVSLFGAVGFVAMLVVVIGATTAMTIALIRPAREPG